MSGVRGKSRDPLLEKMIGKYYLSSELGSGSFGSVYECLNILDGKRYAIKLLPVNEKNRETVGYEVASQEILSKYPDCNKYVLCMHDNGTHVYKKIKAQLDKIEEAKRSGKTIEAQLEEMEEAERSGKIRKTQLIEKVKKAQLEEIVKSQLREVVKAQEMGSFNAQVPGNYYYIVTELMDGDLKNIIELIHKKDVEIDSKSIDFIIKTLVDGLKYIHDRGLAHMDIKPPNVLWRLNPPGETTVTIEECLADYNLAEKHLQMVYGDLGFACVDNADIQDLNKDARGCDDQAATPVYLSPGLVRMVIENAPARNISLKMAQANDVWALAVTIWQLIFGEEPPYLKGIDDEAELIAKLESLGQGFIADYLPLGSGLVPEEIEYALWLMFNPDDNLRVSIDEIATIMAT